MTAAVLFHVAHGLWHVLLWLGVGSIVGGVFERIRGCPEHDYRPAGDWP